MFSHVSFTSIPVEDALRARDFYRDNLGLTVSVDAPFGQGRWIMLEVPGARTRIHLVDRSGGGGRQAQPVLPLSAPELDDAVEQLRNAGVTIAAEPKPAEWDPDVRYAMIRDSEDNLVLVASA